METFEAISYIRNSKNISIEDTLGDNVSQSSYYRYINGESDLYSQNFLTILDNLNISLDEVDLIRRGYKNKEENILLLRIKKLLKNKTSTN